MNYNVEIRNDILSSIETKQELLEHEINQIADSARIIAAALEKGGKLILCGNGGSAADAQHIATEYMIRLRGSFDRPPLSAMALTTDTSLLTAGANDYGFESIFARQIDALGTDKDVLIAISTSGNSENVIRAVKSAKRKEMITIGWLGRGGGKLYSLVDCPICVPHTDSGRIQESHIMIGHITCRLVEETLFPK